MSATDRGVQQRSEGPGSQHPFVRFCRDSDFIWASMSDWVQHLYSIWLERFEALISSYIAAMASPDGLADAWASSTSVIRALNAHGRIIAPDNAGNLKVDNKNAARNRAALTPVLERVALQPNWELIKLPDLGREFLGCRFWDSFSFMQHNFPLQFL